MEELIARVVAATGLSAEQAQQAVNLVLGFLKREAPDEVGEMLSELPGGHEAAAQGEAEQANSLPSGGLVGMMGGSGGIMGLASHLSSLGLGMGEMTTLGKEIFAFARERAGEERVGQVVAAVPGLAQFV